MSTPEQLVDRLLSEPPAEARARAARTFGERAGDRPVVVYGIGEAGRATAAALTGSGRAPVAFADRSASAGQTVDGIDVLDPAEAARRLGADGAFVVAVVNPRVRQGDIARDLRALGCETVIGYPHVAWSLPEALTPRFAVGLPSEPVDAAQDVRRAFDLLSDETSRAEFAEQLRWRVDGEMFGLGEAHGTEAEQYFAADLLALHDDERFVDVGAFDGDTVRSLVAHSGGRFGQLVALEPDPANAAALRATLAELGPGVADRVRIEEVAASDAPGTLTFSQAGTSSSGVAADGELVVRAGRVDDVLADDRATYVKMDIEGAEPLALAGAAATIARDRPIVAVSVYHLASHLWELPLQVSEIVGDGYGFHLRRYAADFFEEVLYAVPDERRVAAPVKRAI